MARLILFFLLVAAVAIALASVMMAMRSAGQVVSATTKELTSMPDAFRNVAYILLVILMVGVCAGWLGAA